MCACVFKWPGHNTSMFHSSFKILSNKSIKDANLTVTGVVLVIVMICLMALYAGMQVWFIFIVVRLYEYLGTCERGQLGQPSLLASPAQQPMVSFEAAPAGQSMKNWLKCSTLYGNKNKKLYFAGLNFA